MLAVPTIRVFSLSFIVLTAAQLNSVVLINLVFSTPSGFFFIENCFRVLFGNIFYITYMYTGQAIEIINK